MLTATKVIGLESSVDRRTAFSASAADTQVEWSFFPAYSNLVPPLSYRERDAARRAGRLLAPNEIGAYASHFKCWESLASSEYDQAIIFEDDVLVDWNAIKILAGRNFAMDDIQFLRLFTTEPVNWEIAIYRLLSPHSHLIRTIGIAFGMQGYLLTKGAARRLVSRYEAVSMPVDWVITRYWEHGLINYCVFPFPVIEKHVPSNIGDGHPTGACLLIDRLLRFGWRLRDRLARGYAERFVIKRSPFGLTKNVGASLIQ